MKNYVHKRVVRERSSRGYQPTSRIKVGGGGCGKEDL